MPPFSWIFLPMRPGEMNMDPMEGEFFTIRDAPDRLVRETLQNSLDESLDGAKVRVRFSVHHEDPLGWDRAKAYFKDLAPHMQSTPGITNEVVGLLGENNRVPFITIEDFGTGGLTGDVNQYDDWEEQPALENNFYWFFRNVGRTGKDGSKGGSWGLGKWVFPDTSKINSFFAYSLRAKSDDTILMGQSVLKKHTMTVGGEHHKYPPYGFFAVSNGQGLQVPIDDEIFQEQFKKDFQLSRNLESGLSLVIPFPDENIRGLAILRAVLRYYFFPILCGDLEVEIEDGADRWLVDLDSAYGLVDTLDWSESGETASDVKKMFELAQALRTTPEADFILAGDPPQGAAPPLLAGRFPEEQLEELRERYHAGERLPFRIPVWVHKRDPGPAMSFFDVIIERDAGISSLQDTYVRGTLTIPDLSRTLSQPVRSLLHVHHDDLQEMLRDSEEPSHSTWRENSPKVGNNHYRFGRVTVLFVKRSVTEIINLLVRIPNARYNDLLQEFFSIDRTAADTPGDPETDPVPPIPDPKPRFFTVDKLQVQGGFRVKSLRSLPSNEDLIEVQVAYNIRRGNPLKKYHSLDFDLTEGPIVVSSNSADIVSCENNTLRFRPLVEGGSITVTGFDKERDIYVKTALVKSEENANQ